MGGRGVGKVKKRYCRGEVKKYESLNVVWRNACTYTCVDYNCIPVIQKSETMKMYTCTMYIIIIRLF